MTDKKQIAIIVLFLIFLTLLLAPYVHSVDSDKDGLDDSVDVYPYDYDNDGMPDNWEDRYNLNPHDASDINQDADNDGFTNIQEYFLGQNPAVADKANSANAENLSPGVKELETITKIVLIAAGAILIAFASFKFITSSKRKKRTAIQADKFSYQQRNSQENFSQRYRQDKQNAQLRSSYPQRANPYAQTYPQMPSQQLQEEDYDMISLEQPNNLKEDPLQVIERLKRELKVK